MPKSFQFARLPQIIFRNGCFQQLPDRVNRYGAPIILVTGEHSFISSENGMHLVQSLNKRAIRFFHVTIPGEPSPEMIDKAVMNYRDEEIKVVVAIGGGSVMDAGKAISAMLTVPGSVKEYLEGVGDKEHPGSKVPFIAVPTTSGTGSEGTKNAVISEVGSNGFKKSLRHDQFVPDIALIDPELTLECPSSITAAAGMDCFTQLTEAFLSEKASDYTDAFARLGLRAVKSSLVRAVKEGNDPDARAGMSYAALNSGICLANAGLGTVHGFASVIGGKYDIPHGLVCGTLMAPANRITVRELRRTTDPSFVLEKYAELGRLFLDQEDKSDDYCIDGFINYLYVLTEELQLPGLSGYGIEKEDVKIICSKTGNKNNPVDLGQEALEEILRERI